MKQKLLDIGAELERERRTREVREQALPSEYHRQTYLLGSGSEGKREIVLNRRPELYRGKISMRSTKDQLVEKDVLMPVKQCVFLWNLPDVEEVPPHDGETV
ncbi:hypothetical protein TNCV_2256261 [Trichonephila clavipes]|nr:hypothetical protein TNCV_2256261 [Trichonephila clavipes]